MICVIFEPISNASRFSVFIKLLYNEPVFHLKIHIFLGF